MLQQPIYETGSGFFQGASHVNVSHGTFNHIRRDHYIYNNTMNDEMVVHQSSYHINLNIIEFRP